MPRFCLKPGQCCTSETGRLYLSSRFTGPPRAAHQAARGIDVVISAVGMPNQRDQIPLATAAKAAGVKRFVSCGFLPVVPAGGVMWMRDEVSPTVVLGSMATATIVFEMTDMYVYSLERSGVQSHQAASTTIHHHRRGLVVPVRIPATAVREDRLRNAISQF